jgi:uncharacterized integral membrane protein
MSKTLVAGLIILGLTVVVFIVQRGSVDVNLLFGTYDFNKALTLMSFTTIGVAVGLLLK